MLDYIFFDHKNLGLFVHELKTRAIEYAIQRDPMGDVISVPDDLGQEVNDELDQIYEQLLQSQAETVEKEDEPLEKDVAGLHITLSDGTPCTIRVEPEMIARLLTVISLEELKGLATTIAQAVEQPDNRPLCHD